MSAGRLRAVLFDLDGTLIDSAPDLAGAANEMRVARGMPSMPYQQLRPMVGSGARGMVGRTFGIAPGDDGFAALRDEFLATYERRMTRETRVYDAMRPVLGALADASLPWGIVTNKATRFAEPLVRALGLAGVPSSGEPTAGAPSSERRMPTAATLVCGDTTPHAKPHPAPLLEAARRLGVPADACVYIGDDHRDVLAGRAAGMATVVAAWGYLGEGAPVDAWGADHVAVDPAAVLQWLRMI